MKCKPQKELAEEIRVVGDTDGAEETIAVDEEVSDRVIRHARYSRETQRA